MNIRLTRPTVAVAALVVALTTTLTTAGPASAVPVTPGTYSSAGATRVLDTRAGTGAPTARLAAGATLIFPATAGLVTPVSALALNITVVDPTASGFVTVWASGAPRVSGSTVNFLAGRVTANATIVRPALDGAVSVYNGSAGTIDVLADRTGAWSGGGPVDPGTGGALNALTSTRLVDTRATGGALAAMAARKVAVLGHGGVPATNVSSVAVNLTVVSPTASGYLAAGAEVAQPAARTSSLNFLAGQNRANLALVPVNPDGTITVVNYSAGSAQVLVDVLGYFNDGTPSVAGSYLPSTAFRVVDTRTTASALPALTTRRLAVGFDTGTAFVFQALAVNITVVTPQSSGYLTAWDGVGGLPSTSNNNFFAGVTSASSTIVPLNPDGTVTIYNGSYGNLDVIIDIDGFVLADLTGNVAPQAAVKRAVASARQFSAHH